MERLQLLEQWRREEQRPFAGWDFSYIGTHRHRAAAVVVRGSGRGAAGAIFVGTVTGLGDGTQVTTEVGTAAIRDSFLRRSVRLQQHVELTGIELNGDFVICRRKRTDTQYGSGQPDHNLRVLLIKEGKIKQVVVLVDPEERARLLREQRQTGASTC